MCSWAIGKKIRKDSKMSSNKPIVNELSVFMSSKFDCICVSALKILR